MDMKKEPKIISKIDLPTHDRDKKRQAKTYKIIESRFGRVRAVQHMRKPISKYG